MTMFEIDGSHIYFTKQINMYHNYLTTQFNSFQFCVEFKCSVEKRLGL